MNNIICSECMQDLTAQEILKYRNICHICNKRLNIVNIDEITGLFKEGVM